MANNNISLVDGDYFRIPLDKPSKKIKLPRLTLNNIKTKWKNFRLERLKSKLEKEKENLVAMEFSNDQLTSPKKKTKVERKVLRKTKAIAKLESKINFLNTGNYLSEDFIDSRAIKLKEMMMNNLIYNRDSLYSVNEETQDEIISGNINNIIDDESNKISERVKQILAEKAANKGKKNNQEFKAEQIPPIGPGLPGYNEQILQGNVSKVIDDNMSAIDVPPIGPGLPGYNEQILQGDVSKVIDNNMSAIDVPPIGPGLPGYNEQILQGNVSKVIDNNMSAIDVNPVISEDEVSAAIDSALNKVDVDENNYTPNPVNRFINEDGTYRLRREDIDEDFRITRIDRSKLSEPKFNPIYESDETDIPPFTTNEREKPEVDIVRKNITPIGDMKINFPKPILPTIKESFIQDNNNRETPLIVPERTSHEDEFAANQTTKPEYASKEESDSDKIKRLAAKIRTLEKQQQILDAKHEEARAKEESVTSAYDAMIERLQDYANALETQCNDSLKRVRAMDEKSANKEAEINAMIKLMENGVNLGKTETVVKRAK